MKIDKTSLKNMALFAGLSAEEYRAIQNRIDQRNLHMLALSSLLGSLLSVMLIAVSFFVPTLRPLTLVYGLLWAEMTFILYLCRRVFPKRPQWALAGCYLLFLTIFAFGMVIGVFTNPDVPATTFCVLLFVVPLLLIDQPLRMSLLILLANLVFIIATVAVKAPTIASVDCVNSVCFTILSIVVNYQMLKSKLGDLSNQARIEHERDTDELTKLTTKSAAQRQIQRYMEKSREPAALVLLDIDNFKAVNDTLGHAYGDAVLRVIGECVRAVFSPPHILCRFGGDEFVLFLVHDKDQPGVETQIKRLVQEMGKHLSPSDSAVSVTCSIGIAFYPSQAENYQELFDHADHALYSSKARGKNCYTFYISRSAVETEIERQKGELSE